MTKYIYRYYVVADGEWYYGSIESDDLADFRRKAIKKYGKSLDINDVKILQGFDKGSVPKHTGLWWFYYDQDNGMYWAKYRVNGETRLRPVSPKTGKYLN